MHQVKENVKNPMQTKKDLHSDTKCAAKFGKVEKFAAAAKSLRTTGIDQSINNKYINVVKAAVINKSMSLFFKNSLQNL